jgi:hypothetical protein
MERLLRDRLVADRVCCNVSRPLFPFTEQWGLFQSDKISLQGRNRANFVAILSFGAEV